MKFLHIIILTIIMSLPASAIEYYEQIIITKTSNRANLRTIQQRLNAIRIKMFIQRSKSSYVVYSKKYDNHDVAKLALKKIKHYFRYARIIKHGASSSKNDKKYFINFALGSSNRGISYALETGYIYDREIFASLAYLSSSSGDISISSMYSSLNYKKYFSKDIDIYAGGILGYSKLEKSGFSGSSSIVFGVQLGSTYKLYDYLDIYTAYQGIYANHIIEIDSTKNAKFGFIHNLQFGVRYKF